MIKQFFGKEPHILHFSMNHIISMDQLFDLFIRILQVAIPQRPLLFLFQFLRSELHPNFKVMRVSGYFQGTDVSVEDLLAPFNEFNPIPVEDRLRCSLGLNGHSVEIKIEPNYFKSYSCAMMSYLEEAIDNIILWFSVLSDWMPINDRYNTSGYCFNGTLSGKWPYYNGRTC